jgi:hypothetical protein
MFSKFVTLPVKIAQKVIKSPLKQYSTKSCKRYNRCNCPDCKRENILETIPVVGAISFGIIWFGAVWWGR